MRTKYGRLITDAELDRMAADAEAGPDVTGWTRRPGRPPLSPDAIGGSSPKIETRIPASLRDDLRRCAAEDGRSVSQVLRELVEAYVADHGTAGGSDRRA